MDDQSFTERARDALAERFPDEDFDIVGPLSLEVSRDGEVTSRIDLSRWFDRLPHEPEPELLDEVVRMHVDRRSIHPLSRRRILPVVRSLTEASPLLLEGALCRILGPDIALLYVHDMQNSIAYLVGHHLDELGLDMDQLHALAVDNLASRELVVHGDGALKMVTCGGYYEAALVLRPDLWLPLVGIDDLEHVAVLVAAHDVLMLCDRRDALALDRLAEIGVEMRDEHVEHSISPELWSPGMPLLPVAPPSDEELQAAIDAMDPGTPWWRLLPPMAVVAVAYLVGGGPAIGEFVQDNGLDVWMSWKAYSLLIPSPFVVPMALEVLDPGWLTGSLKLRLVGLGWVWVAVVFVGTFALCVFGIDAMARTYFLTAVGALVSAYVARQYLQASRRFGERGL